MAATKSKQVARRRDAMADVLGMPRHITRLFDRMGLVEDLIAAAKKTNPGAAANIDRVFQVAAPPAVLANKHDDTYRHHVNELITRAIDSSPDERNRRRNPSYSPDAGDMRPATKAEVLCFCLEASLVAPPATEIMYLIDVLWTEVMSNHAIGVPQGTRPVHVRWTNETSELFGEMRRKFRNDKRIIKEI